MNGFHMATGVEVIYIYTDKISNQWQAGFSRELILSHLHISNIYGYLHAAPSIYVFEVKQC
jgi:hypothetical protein